MKQKSFEMHQRFAHKILFSRLKYHYYSSQSLEVKVVVNVIWRQD